MLGQAETVRGVRELVAQHGGDIVLLDWELADRGEDSIQELSNESDRSVLVVLTRPQPPEEFDAAMRTGIRGYLSVNTPSEEFLAALRMLARGDVIVSREMADLFQASDGRKEEPFEELSGREREVLALVGHGATNREIGESLIVTESTVKVHLRNILGKLNLRNRQQAAAFAAQEGLLNDISPEGPRS